MAEIKVRQVVNLALAQGADQYVFAAETQEHDPDPEACSEFIQWVFHRVKGADISRGA